MNTIYIFLWWFDFKVFSKKCTAANQSGTKATRGDLQTADVHISAVSLKMCRSLDVIRLDAATSLLQVFTEPTEQTSSTDQEAGG